MCPSYFRIRIPLEEAIRRFSKWAKAPIPKNRKPRSISGAHDEAVDDRGFWRGNALFVSAIKDWALFWDMSGVFGGVSAESWLELAGKDELVFAGYNDSILWGAITVIRDGKVVREFLDYAPEQEDNLNVGNLGPDFEPIETWIDVAGIVDDDNLGFSDTGFLWVY